jgi:hypothetical protein
LPVGIKPLGWSHAFHGSPGVRKTMLAERVPGLLPDLGLEDALKWLRCTRSLGCRSCFSEAAAAASQTVSVAVIRMKGHGRYDPARAVNPAPWSPDGATVGERGLHRRATLALHYTLYSTLLIAKQFSFGIFSIALPVILYVIFTQTYGDAGGPDGINRVRVPHLRAVLAGLWWR